MYLEKLFNNLSIIVASTDDGIIGIDNEIPWYIPDDFKYFKNITSGVDEMNELPIYKNIVIMGKNTWESIPNKYKPLKDRINIIISSTLVLEEKLDNVYIYESFDRVFKFIKTIAYNEIFIIGGEQIYKLALSDKYKHLCSKIYLTRVKLPYTIDKNRKVATFEIDKIKDFTLISKSHNNTYKDIEYTYEIYIK
jgi:dihydrofolate reductase